MEELATKEELEELKETAGKVRGVPLKTTSDFILKEEGEEGLRKLEQAMAGLGYPIKREEIRAMDFYPLRLWGLYLVVIKRLFNYSRERMAELGANNAKLSLIIRLFMKYFFSVEKLLGEVPRIWHKYYTVGDLKIYEYQEEENRAVIRLENFKLHPIFFEDLMGYFSGIVKMVTGKPARCELTKSRERGDNYYEFELNW